MYKVLLVEDEMLVRLGIKNSVSWADLDMRVVADASDGKEALEKFVSFSPEIVITDIKMRRMDGFELIKEIRKINERCAIIVISCVDDFNSLREMVEYNITGYLLKASMTMSDVEKILKKAKENLSKSEQGYFLPGEKTNEHEFLTKFMLSGNEEYLSLFEKSIVSDFCPRSLILIHPISPVDGDVSPLTFSSIQDLILGKFDGVILSPIENEGYILVSEESIDSKDVRLDELFKLTKEYMDIELSILIKKLSGNISDLPMKHHTIYDFFQFSNVPMCPQIIDVSNINSEEYIRLNLLGLENEKDTVPADRREEFLQRFNALAQAALISFTEFQNGLVSLLHWHLDIIRYERHEPHPEMTRGIFNSRTLYEAIKLYFYYINEACLKLSGSKQISDPTINEAIIFISKHYQEDLSLADVANKVGFSVNYFSTLFKKEAGKSFVNYLNDIRIEAAKELLENTTMFFYEISERVGYNSFEYFSRIFKTKTGFSLGEWRRLNRFEKM